MSYISQTDIENIAGTTNVAVWSNLDNDDTTANTTRITRAIAVAEDYVEARLRSKFSIPLTAVSGSLPASLTDLIARLAACWLYENRGIASGTNADVADRISKWRAQAEEVLDYQNARTRDWNLVRKSSVDVRAPGVA